MKHKIIMIIIMAVGLSCLTFSIVNIKTKLSKRIIHKVDSLSQIIEPYSEMQKIAKTITTVYDISPYEADAYSYIASRFDGNWNDYIAMIKVESNFKAGLMSNKNCKGLTQLHPNTMKEMCQRMNIRYEDDIIWNDILNVYAGFMYLTEAKKIDKNNYFKIYVGGPNWAKADAKNKEYIYKYEHMIKRESKILELVYKGINK